MIAVTIVISPNIIVVDGYKDFLPLPQLLKATLG